MDKTARKSLYDLYKGSVGPGWWDILDKYVPELLAIDPDCDFYIKEKYGCLRLGVRSPIVDWDRVMEIENAAELASSTVCEFCGQPGKLRTDRSWIQTLCDRCATADNETKYMAIHEATERWLIKAGETLMRYEIWLGGDSTHFSRGVAHMEDGSTADLAAYCNVGIRQDSLLVGVPDEFHDIDGKLRWYPKPGVIEFYNWEPTLKSVTFHNDTGNDIYICGRAYLTPGESVEIRNDMPRKHTEWLFRMQPVGLVYLAETSHSEKEYQALVGQYGLLATRLSRTHPGKVVARFILADCLRDKEPETEGIETSYAELTYEGSDRVIVQTDNARYVFAGTA